MYKILLTNRNMNAYKVGSGDNVTLKAEILKYNSSPSYLENIDIKCYMNYKSNGSVYNLENESVTNIYGISNIDFITNRFIGISKCNCYVTCIIDDELYTSNIIRLNFIEIITADTIITAGKCNMPDNYDRSNFMIIDRTDPYELIYDRMV